MKDLDPARKSIDNEYVSEDSCEEVRQVVDVCYKRAAKLKSLFNQVVLAKTSSSRSSIYWKAVKTYGKGNEVEILMRWMLEDVQILAKERGMRMVTGTEHTAIVTAIEEVSAIPPSLPEHVFQDSSITVNQSGTGTQTNVNASVSAMDSARQSIAPGGTMNFGKDLA